MTTRTPGGTAGLDNRRPTRSPFTSPLQHADHRSEQAGSLHAAHPAARACYRHEIRVRSSIHAPLTGDPFIPKGLPAGPVPGPQRSREARPMTTTTSSSALVTTQPRFTASGAARARGIPGPVLRPDQGWPTALRDCPEASGRVQRRRCAPAACRMASAAKIDCPRPQGAG